MSGSRQELVNWVNDTLQLQISKVDECGKGYVYCQLLDAIYGDIPISRVNFNANNEYEYITNFKILQSGFQTHNIDKPIEVQRLVRCKFQDNLEFLQWFKRFWEMNFPGHDYDPVARRGGAGPTPTNSHNNNNRNRLSTTTNPRTTSSASSRPGSSASRPLPSTQRPVVRKPPASTGPSRTNSRVSSTPTTTSAPNSRPLATAKSTPVSSGRNISASTTTTSRTGGPSSNITRAGSTRTTSTTTSGTNAGVRGTGAHHAHQNNLNHNNTHSTPGSGRNSAVVSPALLAQNEQLNQELEDSRKLVSNLESEYEILAEQVELVTSERDFYFNKLREIEIMVQNVTDLLKQKEEAEAKNNNINNNKNKENGSSSLSTTSEEDGSATTVVAGDSTTTPLSSILDPETLAMLQPLPIIKAISDILYSTEEGFETPAADENGDENMMDIDPSNLHHSSSNTNNNTFGTIPEGEEETF